MIRLVTSARNLDSTGRQIHEVPLPASVAELARDYAHPEWTAETELQYFVNSMPVDPSTVPSDEDIVAITPRMGDPVGVSVALALIALTSSTIQYIRAKRASDKAKRAQELRNQRAYGFDTPSLTAYGEGFRIPFGYGEYRTGGVVIGNRIEPSTTVRLGSELGLQIALGHGPIYQIGGLGRDSNFLTRTQNFRNGYPDPRYPFDSWQFPAGVRINGLSSDGKGVWLSTRLGTFHQSPMPDWSTAATGVDVAGSPMTTIGDQTTYTTTETDVTRVSAVLRFTEGLWFDGSNGIGKRKVFLRAEWRVGSNAWAGRDVVYEADPPMLNAFDYWVDFQVPPGGGPYELRITRVAPDQQNQGYHENGNHVGQAHSVFEWTSVQIQYGTAFSYPGLAMLAVKMPGSEQLNGQVNNVSVPIKARKVRAYVNEALQWTPELWAEVPPWTYPLSNNPAWAAVDLMTNARYGLGRLIRDRDIDLDAFRDWADYCDQNHPLDSGQPLLRFDGQFDTGSDAIEALAAVFAAGRAVPILVGGKIGVKFSYRDSFSRGSGPTLNTVPARVPVGLITTSSCRSFSISYSDPATDPQVIEWQIIDRDADYEMRTVALEDAGKTTTALNDRPSNRTPRKETQQVLGVVRRLQARYEIQLQHNRNRLSRRSATVQMPIQAVPYEVGDLVILQHDALTPGAATTQSCRTRTGGTVSSVVVSKALDITGANPRTDFGVWLFGTDGVERQLTANYTSPTSIPEGGTLSLWDPVALTPATVTIQKGTELICGPFASTRQVYEITSITTEQPLTRTLELDEWHPEMFDMPAEFDGTDGLGELASPQVIEVATDAAVEVSGTYSSADGLRTTASILWAPESSAISRLARVYARTEDGRFSLLGETASDRLEGLHLHPGSSYEVHVCRQHANGVFPLPEQVTPVTLTVPEFGESAPQAPPRLSYVVDNTRVHLHWVPVDDALYYEVRRGETWYGAEVLGVTQGTSFDVLMPPAGTSRYLLKPRGRSGLYADTARTADVAWQPVNVLATATYLTSAVTGGTATDVVWDGTAGAATIASGQMRGTWTAPVVDMGKDVFAYWSAGARVWAVDGASDFDDFARGRPARFYEVAGGRQATRIYPGTDFDAGIAVAPVEGYEDANAVQPQLGEWVRVQVQTRFHVGGSWGAWGKHVPGWRLARQMEARIQLDRYALDIAPFAKTFVLTVGQ